MTLTHILIFVAAAALYLTVALLAAPFKKAPAWTILTALALAIFPSTLSHLRLGQVSLLVCLALVLLSVRRAQLSAIAAGALPKCRPARRLRAGIGGPARAAF